MPAANPVIYNYQNLYSWQEELVPLEQQIAEYLQYIEMQKGFLKPLQQQLSPKDRRIFLIKEQIVESQNYFELSTLEQQANELCEQMQPYEQRIREVQSRLDELCSRQAWLHEHIPAAQLFLKNLQENPVVSVQQLIGRIWEAFNNYEDTHLFNLSPQTRISLLAARNLHLLTSYEASEYIDQYHRTNYLRLCGFLWDVYSKVKQEKKDAEFEKILRDLVESTHVDRYGDLPSPMSTNYTATDWFEGNKRNNQEYFAIKEQDLLGVEEQIFNYALTYILKNIPSQPTALQKHIIQAALLIDEEVKLKRQKHESIDYHFYGRAAFLLSDVFVSPFNKQSAQRLGNLAEHATGSSIGNEILGALILTAGIALIFISAYSFAATFGLSSILSVWGVSVGLGLLEMQLAGGLLSSVVGAAGVGLTFFGGKKYIEPEKREGLSRELMEIKEGVENYGEPPSYPYAVPVYH